MAAGDHLGNGGATAALSLREVSGAFGDLGTLLPLTLGAIAVGGLAPAPVLAGYGLFYVLTALVYRLPVPVQPMKAMAAVLLTTQLGPGVLAAAGVMIGAALLLLAATGWAGRLARAVPQSVLAGLQLGLGLALGALALDLMASAPVVAAVTLALLVVLLATPRLPAALVALLAAALLARLLGLPSIDVAAAQAATPLSYLPSLAELQAALSLYALPQLALTLTNAVLLTAVVAHDYFGERARHVTATRLCLTSGLANLLLVPFGAMPMCHGAGGLVAHYRFGARTQVAPLLIGAVLLVLALLPGTTALALLAAIPLAGLGALLAFAAAELALSRRLFDARPSCWPVIAVTAAVTAWHDPFWGLLAGLAAEIARVGLLRLLGRAPGS